MHTFGNRRRVRFLVRDDTTSDFRAKPKHNGYCRQQVIVWHLTGLYELNLSTKSYLTDYCLYLFGHLWEISGVKSDIKKFPIIGLAAGEFYAVSKKAFISFVAKSLISLDNV